MELVGAFVILRGLEEGDLEISSIIKPWDDKFKFNDNESGNFYWGNSPLSQYGFSMPFYIVSNSIVCFTTHLNHAERIQKHFLEMYDYRMKICRIPFNCNSFPQERGIDNYKVDPIIGVSFLLNSEELTWRTQVRIFTNGITNFTITDNEKVIKKVINISMKLSDGVVH